MNQGDAWGEVQRLIAEIGWKVATNLESRLSPLNLLAMLALCFVLWRLRRPAASFLAWVFPARIYRHPSFRLDLKVYVLNWVISLFVVANTVGITAGIAAAIATLTGASPPAPGPYGPVIAAFVVFVASDFLTYWYHRVNHDWPWLWPVHALHHSAEELNPVTAYRHHPLYMLIAIPLFAVVQGTVQALLLLFVTGAVDVAVLAGTNLFYALFNLFTSNLRHSHIWLRFPRAVEHVFISPALHQTHHSVDPRHHNRNYGEVLALWDWMFGTLYIPQDHEVIRFGLGDAEGRPLPQPHPTLRAAVFEPLQRLAGRKGADTE